MTDRENLPAETTTNPEKLFQQGMFFRFDGEGADDAKAREYLLTAAKLNHAEAQYELSLLLSDCGNEFEAEALEWLKCAVGQGFARAEFHYAKSHIPHYYRVGFELSKDERDALIDKAFAWFRRQAEMGDAKTQYKFAEMILDELNEVERSDENKLHAEAVYWLKESAAQDYAHACRWLGREYLHTTITEYTTGQGIYWLSHAADLGDWLACKELGDLYFRGRIVYASSYAWELFYPQRLIPDKIAAAYWYKRAIELYPRMAAYTTGLHYLYNASCHHA